MFKLSKVLISLIAYNTEIIDKVKQCITFLFPLELRSKILQRINAIDLIGSYNEKLTLLTCEVVKTDYIRELLHFLFVKLSQTERSSLLLSFKEHYNPRVKSFYLRIDKFSILQNKMKLGIGSDIIKIEIKYAVYRKISNKVICDDIFSYFGVTN